VYSPPAIEIDQSGSGDNSVIGAKHTGSEPVKFLGHSSFLELLGAEDFALNLVGGLSLFGHGST
jgi:hypothetical protein